MTTPTPRDPLSLSGRRLLVELCQFVFLLRLLGLTAIVFSSATITDWRTLAVLVGSCVLSLVGTFTLHRALRFVAAHPLIVAADITVSALGVWASDVDLRFLLALTSALLIGLLHRGAVAAALVAVLVLASLVAVDAATGPGEELSVRFLLQTASMFAVTFLAAAVVRSRILVLAQEVAESGRARAHAEERARMAREMHDGVVKTLHGLALSAQALARRTDTAPDLGRQLDRFAEAAEYGVRQAREALVELRVEQDDRPLGVVVGEIVQRWGERARVATEVVTRGGVDVAGPARVEGLACLREALDNVAEHAGAASVRLTMDSDPERCVLTVTDDGRGFAPRALGTALQTGHYGVRGMTERMPRVGGEVEIVSAAGAGTTVRIEIPQPKQGRSDRDPDRVPAGREATT